MPVYLKKPAAKYLASVNEPQKTQIDNAIEKLSRDPPEGDIIPLTGYPGIFRLKVGGYRLLFDKRPDGVYVFHVGPRGQAYNKDKRGKKMTDLMIKEKPALNSLEDITYEELTEIEQHIKDFEQEDFIPFADYMAGKTS